MTERDDNDDDDRKNVLRDGGRLRVPLWTMDGMQKEIAQRDHRQSVVTDAFGETGLALHRPGARYLVPLDTTGVAVQTTLRMMRDEEYQQHNMEQSVRWANSDREIVVKLITGDARTDAYLAREEHDSNAWRGADR